MEIELKPNLLENRRVAFGVSGSISIYKSIEVIRALIKAGAKVKVVMSRSAQEFITPLLFEAITKHEVLTDSSQSWSTKNNHIDFTKDCDIFIIAPVTANSINKIANGVADNILLESTLASKAPMLLAPAANSTMIDSKITKKSISYLKEMGFGFIESQSKRLACGDVGIGALEEPMEIFWRVARELLSYGQKNRVLITGGGTSEKIDSVRVISNLSSGKMANALAISSYLRGCDVSFVSSSFATNLPKEIKKFPFSTSDELKSEIDRTINTQDALFQVAAISDFVPTEQKGKIKKDSLEFLDIRLSRSRDILESLKDKKLIKVGFKAEVSTSDGERSAKEMLDKKSLDGVCLNYIDKNGFGSDYNAITLVTKDGSFYLGESDKLTLSFSILDTILYKSKV